MTKQHDLGYYDDGNHVSVAYCKRCSAEGEKLLEDCLGPMELPTIFHNLTKEEFSKKYPNPLDENKLKR